MACQENMFKSRLTDLSHKDCNCRFTEDTACCNISAKQLITFADNLSPGNINYNTWSVYTTLPRSKLLADTEIKYKRLSPD